MAHGDAELDRGACAFLADDLGRRGRAPSSSRSVAASQCTASSPGDSLRAPMTQRSALLGARQDQTIDIPPPDRNPDTRLRTRRSFAPAQVSGPSSTLCPKPPCCDSQAVSE